MAQRTSWGMCGLCGARKSKPTMIRHLWTCVPGKDVGPGSPAPAFQLRVQPPGSPLYWLDVEVGQQATMKALDAFLRRIWLECCGHLSAFRVSGLNYSVIVDTTFGVEPNARSMNLLVGEVLHSVGQRFSYEYDFGSTTELVLNVWGAREAAIGRSPVRLLARNEPPVWPCGVCGAAASVVCVSCQDEGDAFYCPAHAAKHECRDGPAFLPVVNSPRMGVCGYTGEA